MANLVSRSPAAPSFARALFNTSQVPLLLFDGDLRVVCATPSFCTAFGVGDDKIDGRGLADLGAGEWNMPQLRLLLENALLVGAEPGGCETDLVRPGVDDRRLVVSVQGLLHQDEPSARVLLTIEDVTGARNIAQANVALLLEKDDLLREREVLMQEMQHRVANSLQIIASVLLLKARAVTSEESRLHLKDAHDRVMSIAAVQQHLRFGLVDVEVGPYLTKLCASLATSMIRDTRPLKLTVRADEATVSSHEAVSLGLIVTELVINALKHAFPDDRGGEVTVSYDIRSPGWTLSVKDDGIGRPEPSTPTKIGLGTSVVEALARQLGASVVMSDAGPGAEIQIVNLEGAARQAELAVN